MLHRLGPAGSTTCFEEVAQLRIKAPCARRRKDCKTVAMAMSPKPIWGGARSRSAKFVLRALVNLPRPLGEHHKSERKHSRATSKTCKTRPLVQRSLLLLRVLNVWLSGFSQFASYRSLFAHIVWQSPNWDRFMPTSSSRLACHARRNPTCGQVELGSCTQANLLLLCRSVCTP